MPEREVQTNVEMETILVSECIKREAYEHQYMTRELIEKWKKIEITEPKETPLIELDLI